MRWYIKSDLEYAYPWLVIEAATNLIYATCPNERMAEAVCDALNKGDEDERWCE